MIIDPGNTDLHFHIIFDIDNEKLGLFMFQFRVLEYEMMQLEAFSDPCDTRL
jgi:hypothetical protein